MCRVCGGAVNRQKTTSALEKSPLDSHTSSASSSQSLAGPLAYGLQHDITASSIATATALKRSASVALALDVSSVTRDPFAF